MPASTFRLDVSKFVDKTKARLDLVVRKIALELFTRVVLKSPVDTGRFRANWQLAIGDIPDDVLELDDKAGTATVSRGVAASQGVRAGDVVYLVNNLPYGPRLEYGWSQQAPAGMVRISIAEIQTWLDGVVDAAKRQLP